MGNCLHRAESGPQNSENWTFSSSEDYDWSLNYTYNYTDDDLNMAAPCRSCVLLDDTSLPFFAITSALGILGGGILLFALLKPLACWNLCPDRTILAQLAGGSTLFSIVLPILAPGWNPALDTVVCCMAHGLWYASAFAQALLVCAYSCLGPELNQSWLLKLSLAVWSVALLMALPVTLASDVVSGFCILPISNDEWVWPWIHIVACIVIFLILPLGLVQGWAIQRVKGRGSGPWANVLWVWFLFWWLHAIMIGLDALVRTENLSMHTCFAQQTLDFLLQSARILGILHCLATPLLLALFCHRAT
ncbi:atypical chemokine receptor 1 [Monodelphis domestica]|uniref:atypical chemokine receptor 1 n=1 Tax=Monodelphis domestica TaxID=13616 RepID=UPI0024E25650|nr:atypical chemokine receptor 1 [Monodelphis domestica]